MEACVLHAVKEKKLVQQVTNKKYSSEEIESNYKPVSHKREQYPRNLRVKINTTGSNKTRFWSKDRTLISDPITSELEGNAEILLKGIWTSSDGPWGIIAECTHFQVSNAEIECPFE